MPTTADHMSADPLNVNHADFITAMNKIVALVKARRRRLLETHAISRHDATLSPCASTSARTSRAATPNRSGNTPRCGTPSRGIAAKKSNAVSPNNNCGSQTQTLAHTVSSSSFVRTAKAATPAHTEEALAQIAQIRGKHSHQHQLPPATAAMTSSTNRQTAAADEHPPSPCHHTQQATDRLPHRNPYAPVLVALAGAAGSGKTTAVKHIVQYLANMSREVKAVAEESNVEEVAGCQPRLLCSTPIRSVAVPLDGYHRYRSELEKMPDSDLAFIRRGAPFTFNPCLYERDLLVLLDSGKAKFPSFEHHIKDPAEEDIVIDCHPAHHCLSNTSSRGPSPSFSSSTGAVAQKGAAGALPSASPLPFDFGIEVVIVEGLYTLFSGDEQREGDGSANKKNASIRSRPIPFPLSEVEKKSWKAASKLYDVRLFVDSDLDTTTERLTLRHMKAWGISREEAFQRASGSDYDNSVIVNRTSVNADVVLRSVDVPSLAQCA